MHKRKRLWAALTGAVVLCVAAFIHASGVDLHTIGLLLTPLLAVGVAVVDRVTERTTPEEHKVRDVSSVLTKIRPTLAPVDTILRAIGTQPASAVKVEWEEDELIPREDTVASATTAGAAGDPVTVQVNMPAIWRPHDVILTYDSGNPVLLLVTAVSGNSITVYRLINGSDLTAFGAVPDLAANQKLYRLATAKPEFGTAGSGRATMPVQKFNWTQIYEAVIEFSNTRARTRNYTQDDRARAEEQALYDYRTSIEQSTIFGQPSNILDPTTGEFRRTAAGILWYLQTNFVTYNNSSDPLTEAKLMDLVEAAFSGVTGSQQKFLVASPGLITKIDKILLTAGSPNYLMADREKTKRLGLEITTVRTGHGVLNIVKHEGLRFMGKQEWGLVFDPAYIRRRVLRPMTRKDVTPPDLDGVRIQWLEESTVEVRYEKAHAVIYNVDTDTAK